ncbi:MAG: histidine phosphatase family protein [Granulosicoccus sp.]
MSFKKAQIATVIGAAILAATAAPIVSADNGHRADRTVIYMTRHAEKQNDLDEKLNSVCKSDFSRCEEELSALGELRAELLAEWFEDRGILHKITDVISSDKQRTRQTVEPTARKLLAMGVHLENLEAPADRIPDGVRQVPFDVANTDGNELNGNSGSVVPTLAAIEALEPGSVALVAVHSGTIYRIMGGGDTDGNPNTPKDGSDTSVGLGIDTTVGIPLADITLFPKKESDGKLRTFGDIWKIVINNNTGNARVAWRKNLQPLRLSVENQTLTRGNKHENRYW